MGAIVGMGAIGDIVGMGAIGGIVCCCCAAPHVAPRPEQTLPSPQLLPMPVQSEYGPQEVSMPVQMDLSPQTVPIIQQQESGGHTPWPAWQGVFPWQSSDASARPTPMKHTKATVLMAPRTMMSGWMVRGPTRWKLYTKEKMN